MEYLKNEYKKNLNEKINKFNIIIKIIENYYNKPIDNILELKKKNINLKGEIFEYLCFLYLKNHYKLEKVWSTNKNNYCECISEELREELKLSKRDMGIDFIGKDKEENYYAIQAKYRKRYEKKRTTIPWKQLSTFYGLVLKTGPYKKHIIFTNADNVTYIGYKTNKDETIGYNKLSKIDHFEWLNILELSNKIKEDEINNLINKEENIDLKNLKLKMIKYFEKN